MDAIDVIESGLLTTVQDLGRYGYQRYGVPVSGALDLFAHRAGNRLVGNPDAAAGLEITLVGPELLFLADLVIAITGADLDPRLNGRPAPMWQTVAAREGDRLTFGGQRDGIRAYLAFAGGIDVPLVLGSRSTYTRSKFGGLDGRPLKPGDRLRVTHRAEGGPVRMVRVPAGSVPAYGRRHEVRVVLGPQDEAFSDEGLRTFLSGAYTVTPQSDRIGYRLQGPKIEHRTSPDIVSDGIPFGAVQVSGDGMPIVLLADRGSTGGYTKIATVASVDLARFAQALPGDEVAFRAISVDEAHGLIRAQELVLDSLEEISATGVRGPRPAAVAAAAAAVAACLEEERSAR